jgi:Flp pilus assembly pilin Flp
MSPRIIERAVLALAIAAALLLFGQRIVRPIAQGFATINAALDK